MVNGLYHHLRKAWKKTEPVTQERLIAWRASEAVEVQEHPLRLDRAHSLGYKAKKGFVVVRVRVKRGGRTRPRHKHGRKSRKQHIRLTLKMNYQWVAELRAAKKFPNLEVLNSYNLGKDGKHYFYEVILIDPMRPEIKNDKNYSWINNPANTGRVYRGLTSAGKRARGLVRSKSPNMKVRPSLRAWNRQGK